MIVKEQLNRLLDSKATVLDSEGNKIGTVGELYLDDRSQDPSWASVKTGLFGMSQSFVPLDEATVEGDDIRVPYTKEQVKDAPRIDPDGHLEPEDEERLYRHYGLSGDAETVVGTGTDTGSEQPGFSEADTTGYAATDSEQTAGYARTDTESGADSAARDTEGYNTDDAMTRSEERLHVGTETQEAGRARLRKYVVTENETRTVPVSHEEVRIEREPITDGTRDDALAGANLREEEQEVTLHAERPVVEKETVPVERVRLDTETVTEQETVNEEISREEITPDTDTGTDPRPRKH
ncbi:DUF2382 domain-containing protein [Paeniglutamicibacter gangotriensis]|uniref:DUF2382 domain-containing protein n=1 Tax=Paeniglutamicibacter gangotriensis TaxID=254787 RepID=A0A5B0EAS8_9MICC|nr:PRC and DUF2382 domain-containing protein [Paeniglutamicibacter gangotriensis]KAA0975265.1 DUF2382 domain-containing protein [Paeniglutamicibacter gangotriensis]